MARKPRGHVPASAVPGAAKRRWPRPVIAAVLAVLLVAGLGVSWFQARDHIGRQTDMAADSCVEGKAQVPIVASPDIAEALGEIAKRYNDTHPVVRDKCVSVQVRPEESRATLDALRGTWDTAKLGPRPAAWIPQSSVWAAELAVAKPGAAEGAPDSLVTSPVVLALPTALAAKAGRKLAWGRMPALTQNEDAMGQFGLPAWGSLRLAMPTGVGSDATALAAQAIAAQIGRMPGRLTAAKATSTSVTGGVNAVLSAAPKAPENSAAAAVAAMAKGDQRKGIHAVPITEQQLFQLTKTPEVADKIRGYSPAGVTPVADYPVLRLGDDGTTSALPDAVAHFVAFAKQPAQLAVLTALGYRAGRMPMPPGTAAVRFAPVRRPLTAAPGAAVAIDKLVYSR
ncbi:hypothetical protein [Gordonia sp. (in: high G+C Gram-positive bacteria)]|uniref:hypothetical protein n=1 Tax=Gordonia sp. (in: high G+C Gram-positive bacteria) TaxID=84139 RepID=UPI0039E63AF7